MNENKCTTFPIQKARKKIAKTTNKDFCVPFYITRKIKIRAEINDVRTEKQINFFEKKKIDKPAVHLIKKRESKHKCTKEEMTRENEY